MGCEFLLLLTLHLFWVTLPRAVDYVHSVYWHSDCIVKKLPCERQVFQVAKKAQVVMGELYGDVPNQIVFLLISEVTTSYSSVDFRMSLQLLIFMGRITK